MKYHRVLLLAIMFGLFALSSAHAHTLKTATNVTVTHNHYTGNCIGIYCIQPDSTFETAWGFSSSHRWYPASTAWNCHGRTFDARRSWVHIAEPWLLNDAPFTPASPGPGDTIIWWENGQTSHSVTIVGSWNGLSTLVMSKYGMQGQYRHALSKPVLVYKSNWAVTRFGAGTVIYSGFTDTGSAVGNKARSEAPAEEDNEVYQKLARERERMPWYETVLESEALVSVERPKLIRRIAGLTEEGRNSYLSANSDLERTTALFADFVDPAHYGPLGAYDSPVFSEEFIKEIEAGKLLVALAQRRPENRLTIVDGLQELAFSDDLEFADHIRGAALHFLSQMLDEEERQLLKDSLNGVFASRFIGDIPTYTQHYLDLL